MNLIFYWTRRTAAIINIRASAWASNVIGKWIAIWSPSKSALNALQTNGWICIAFPKVIFGWNAWIPRRCKVGALFNKIGCPFINISRISFIILLLNFILSFAVLIFFVNWSCSNFCIIKGWKSSIPISKGNPHSYSFNLGSTIITDRAEKLTLFPSKFCRNRPFFPCILLDNDFNGRLL